MPTFATNARSTRPRPASRSRGSDRSPSPPSTWVPPAGSRRVPAGGTQVLGGDGDRSLPLLLDAGRGLVERAFVANVGIFDQHRRSEERRVGKEWRSRWSPYH